MRHAWLCVFACLVVAGCGGKSGGDCADNGGPCAANGDCCSNICDPNSGACAEHGPECTATGSTCATDAECCTGTCDPSTMTCVHDVTTGCLMANADCSVGPDCCSFSCVGFKCSGNQCTSDGGSCSVDGECCGGICSGGTCAPLNAGCKTSGNACTGNSQCCSGYCTSGTCSNGVSFCTQVGDTCVTDQECCAGLCNKAQGASLGTCSDVPSSGATGCATMGQLCGAGASYTGGPLPTCGGECCSRACFPYGPSGALVCQPPSGCHPTGELCTKDTDCCGSKGLPDGDRADVMCRKDPGFALGRCDNGNSCAAAGMICRLDTIQCNATADCCGGNVHQVDICHQDALGIPRCGVAIGPCTDPSTKVGMACASSADCCGGPCTAVQGGEGFVCGASCMQQGASCTTNTDCCSGLPCNIPPGSTMGTCGSPQGCADYGQACTMSSDCCNMLPCTNGVCTGVIL